MKRVFNLSVVLAMMAAITFTGCSKEDNPETELSTTFDVTYVKEFEKNIYPSFIFGMTDMEVQAGEPFDYFTISVEPSELTDLRIVIEQSKVNDETIITQKAVSGKTEIIPNVKWKYDELKKMSQAGAVDITFVCYAGTTELGRKSLKLNIKSINECILYILANGQVLNTTPFFAGYVNENSPVIDAFMKEVLDADTLITSFTGYQVSIDEVFNQVDAIFNKLRKKGIKYSDITAGGSTNTDYLVSQHIRFADEVLTNTQANCADGTAFFCSVLQKIGIKSLMVFEPGHVYLGYYLDAAKKNIALLETTAVGSKMTFLDASFLKTETLNANLTKYQNNDYTDGYFVVDVSEARKVIKSIGR